jgi:hypothetical protein
VRRAIPFRGETRADTQFWTYETGECIKPESPLTVPCHEEHTGEVVGTVTLPDGTVLPSEDDRDGWSRLLSDGCQSHGRTYLGRQPRDPWIIGWRSLAAESWAAGKRTVTCVAGQSNGADWLIVTGSARGQAA